MVMSDENVNIGRFCTLLVVVGFACFFSISAEI